MFTRVKIDTAKKLMKYYKQWGQPNYDVFYRLEDGEWEECSTTECYLEKGDIISPSKADLLDWLIMLVGYGVLKKHIVRCLYTESFGLSAESFVNDLNLFYFLDDEQSN